MHTHLHSTQQGKAFFAIFPSTFFLKKCRNTILSMLIFGLTFFTFSSQAQTVTVNLDWDGSDVFNPGCVPASMTHACGNNTGVSLGSWNDGTRTFSDPIPAGKVLTNISVTAYMSVGTFAEPSPSVVIELNGVAFDVAKTTVAKTCTMLTTSGTFPTVNYTSSVSAGSYNYGAVNSIRFNATAVENGPICLDKAIVVLTYADPAITLIDIPSNTSISCDDPIPTTAPTATGGCSNVTIVENPSTPVGTQCLSTLIRTWTATDNCGTTATASQTITISDFTSPVFPELDSPLEFSCFGDVPLANESLLFASDNCEKGIPVSIPTDVITPGSCVNKFTITRTWSATDACGNNAVTTQIITVNDNIKPAFEPSCQLVFNLTTGGAVVPLGFDANLGKNITESGGATCPASATISLSTGQIVNAFDNWTAGGLEIPYLYGCIFDNCTSLEDMRAKVESISNVFDGCKRTITVKFRALDLCGNESANLFVCIVNINDNVKPTIDYMTQATLNFHTSGSVAHFDPNSGGASCPASATFNLNLGGIVPAGAFQSVAGIFLPSMVGVFHDNCTSDANIRLKVVSVDNVFDGCTRTFTIKYRSLDACNNEGDVLFTRIVNVTDDTKPTVVASCNVMFRVYTEGEVNVLNRDGSTTTKGFICPEDATTNLEMNQIITASQTWVVGGVTIPNMLGCLKDNCTSDANMKGKLVAMTNVFDGCERTFVFSFAPIDACGNESKMTVTTSVVIRDNTLPKFVYTPKDVTYNCELVPCEDKLTATDNCDKTPTVVFLGEVRTDGNCPHNYKLTRSWKAFDDCNNQIFHTQYIQVIDTTKPVFVPVFDQTFECSAFGPALLHPMINDNCSKPDKIKIIYEGEVRKNLTCPGNYTLLRKWNATDECGNKTTMTQLNTVIDKEAPKFVYTPPKGVISCSDTPIPVPPKAEDRCSAQEDIKITLVSTDCILGKCPIKHTLRHYWEATDLCGNKSTWNTYTEVRITKTPTFTTLPTTTLLGKKTLPPMTSMPTAKSECDDNAGVQFLGETTVNGNCPTSKIITRTYRAIDNCGNSSTATETFITGDDSNPVFSTALPKKYINYADLETQTKPNVSASDACGAVLITGPVLSQNKLCNNGLTEFYWTWTATDQTGNTTLLVQTFAINDAIPKVNVTAPTNIVMTKTDKSLTANVTGGAPPYTYQWLPTANSWNVLNITGNKANIQANRQKGEFNVIVTDSRGCRGTTFFAKEAVIQCPTICTLADTFYVDPTDTLKGKTSVNWIEDLLKHDIDGDGNADPIKIGAGKRSFVVTSDAANCLSKIFPSAKTGVSILTKDSVYLKKDTVCNYGSLKLKGGKLENQMLEQLIVLALNMRYDPKLGYLPIKNTCTNIKLDTFTRKHINDLPRKDSTKTVKALYDFSNLVMSGFYTSVKQNHLDSLYLTIKAINDCFAGCRNIEAFAGDRSFAADGLRGSIYHNQSALRWYKISTQSIKKFDVEYSIDDKKYSILETRINPYFERDEAHYFDIIHEKPVKGANYYRIKQYFNDNTTTYSNVVLLDYKHNPFEVRLMPNPATDIFYLTIRELEKVAKQPIDIIVSNELGIELSKKTIDKIGSEPIEMSTEDLPSGMYVVRIMMDNIVLNSQKLVILRR